LKAATTGGRKTLARPKPRGQCGALPYRLNPDLEILLVTSRDTGRWVIPKGWTMKSKTRREAAEQEAIEEAGVEGKTPKTPLGVYDYVKVLRLGDSQLCKVTVFALHVTLQRETWREQALRSTRWFAWEAAAALVQEPGLKRIIARFAKAQSRDRGSAGHRSA